MLLLFLLINLIILITSQPLLFPHGYFDVNKLQPRDAIYLNMMAQSNLEYGGTTLEELEQIVKDKNKVPLPPKKLPSFLPETASPNPGKKEKENGFEQSVNSVREDGDNENFPTLVDGSLGNVTMEHIDKDFPRPIDLPLENMEKNSPKPPKTPFSKIRLYKKFRRLNDEAMEDGDEESEESDNPFEEIVTRAPPGGRRRKKKRGRKGNLPTPQFLTRDTIIRPEKIKVKKVREHGMERESEKENGWKEEFSLPSARPINMENLKETKEELAESYRKHRSTTEAPITGSPEVISSYHTKRKQLSTKQNEENRGNDELESREMEQIVESFKRNVVAERKTTHKHSTVPPTPTVPSSTSFPTLNMPPSDFIPLPNNPYSQVKLSQPSVVLLPVPPSMWTR